MKQRSGFVSNSSSSSFIVAVPNKAKTCKCCKRSDGWMLQAVQKYLTTLTPQANKFIKITGAEDLMEYFKEELVDLEKSKTHSQEQLKTIAELEANPDVFKNYRRLSKQMDYMRYKESTQTQEAKYASAESELPADTLKKRKEQIQKHLSDYETKHKELVDLISKLKSFIKKDYTVYSFDIDNWASDAESALKSMMNDGIVELLWKEVR